MIGTNIFHCLFSNMIFLLYTNDYFILLFRLDKTIATSEKKIGTYFDLTN
jgi:hypothetical protein